MTTSSDATPSVVLRYLDLDPDALPAAMLAGLRDPESRDRERDWALARLGIVRHAGEGPLAAWCRAMAEENGLPVETPALASAVLTSPVGRFVWWLA